MTTFGAILALALLADVEGTAPRPIKYFATTDECVGEAEKLNRTTPELKTPEAREVGAEFVCLKIVRGTI